MDCVFCKIAAKEIPKNFIHEDERIVAFADIKPAAPVHYLVVPKAHVVSVKDLTDVDRELVGDMVLVAKHIAADLNLKGYKLVFNVGREGGQIIDHIHLHLLGGWEKGVDQ